MFDDSSDWGYVIGILLGLIVIFSFFGVQYGLRNMKKAFNGDYWKKNND